ncbi:hypothetical protein MKW98_016150 [Papaver atlanticum]|uniref:Uncharacterized protein n=1 Tax=Papaver atlanticum TaxID=357466 RepID=A0AAD4X6I1_9MAGN|nr:hypothetical protein MKW98_016150 [Papaver atlanticum]
MCRGGRMFAPTRILRRWHRKISVNQKRYAIVSALAASAVPSIVLARGHTIEGVLELPLVVNDSIEGVEKTTDAEKVKDSEGKMRNIRYVFKKGPLVEESAATRAAGKAWYQTMISDSDYTEFDVFQKWLGVSQ